MSLYGTFQTAVNKKHSGLWADPVGFCSAASITVRAPCTVPRRGLAVKLRQRLLRFAMGGLASL